MRTNTHRSRRHGWRRVSCSFLVFGLLGFVLLLLLLPSPARWVPDHLPASRRVLDRHGELLRHHPSSSGTYHHPVKSLSALPDEVLLSILHAEDKRFYHHPGFDPLAALRSLVINLERGKITTGASTISQQLVKLTRPPAERLPNRWLDKLYLTLLGVKLDLSLPKDAILLHYINHLPYTHQIVGIEAASRYYFSLPASRLDWARAALLAVIPRAPHLLDPRERIDRALPLQRALLATLHERRVIDDATYREALRQPIFIEAHHVDRPASPSHLHATLHALSLSRASELHTTLDASLQRSAHHILSSHVARHHHRDISQAAAIVLDNATGDVLVHIGSTDYFDASTLGSNDGVLMKRRPGSTLKPFIYARYLERGGTLADPILDDSVTLATPRGAWSPQNFDRATHGPLSVREALASSLNIPAVLIALWLGAGDTLEQLRALGFELDHQAHAQHGAGIALGNAEVSLLTLATAYAAFARQGQWMASTHLIAQRSRLTRSVFSEETAYMILSTLSDDAARAHGFGRGSALRSTRDVWMAVKTGTSTGYRDTWAVGLTSRYTIAVWAGNFDGTPTLEMTGATGAAPILRQIALMLHEREPSRPKAPPLTIEKQSICSLSGQSTLNQCLCQMRHDEWFLRGVTGASGHVDAAGRHPYEPSADSSCAMHLVEQDGAHAIDPPASWLEWLIAHRPDLRLATRHPTQGSTRGIKLIEPLDDQIFFASPDGTATIRLRAIVPLTARQGDLWWWHRGRPIQPATAPFLFTLRHLEPGDHTFSLGTSNAPLTPTTHTRIH